MHSDFFKRGVRHPHTFALLLLLGGQQACSPSPSASSAAGSTDTEGSSTTTNTQTATSGSATLDPQSSNTSDSDVDSGDITTIDSSDHTSESGAQACAGGNRCVPVAPIGWNGPLEALLGERDAACGEAYPEEVTALLLGLRALPSSCDCECAVEGATCPDEAVVRMREGACNVIGGDFQDLELGAECTHLGAAVNPRSVFAGPVDVLGGACVVGTQQLELGEVTTTVATLCAGPMQEPTCSESEVCAASADHICVWRDGDTECPQGYPTRIEAFREVDDTRACECDCTGDVQGHCDGGYVQFYDFDDFVCGAESSEEVPLPTACSNTDCTGDGAHDCPYARYFPGEPDPDCGPAIGTAVGDVVLDVPVSLCCVE